MRNGSFRASLRAAASGLVQAWRSEPNLRFQAAAAYAALLLGAWAGLPPRELALLLLTAAAVLAAELVNTAVERLADLAAASAYHPLARTAKDVAAGAVLVLAGTALGVGVLLFAPRWPDLAGAVARHLTGPAGWAALLPLAGLVAAWLAGRRGR